MSHREDTVPIGMKTRDRRTWVIIGLALLCALLIGGAGGHLFWVATTERAEKEQAQATAEQLCEQVERMGRRCEVQPPLRGERGEKGEPGVPGRDGVDGRDGEDGKDGKAGKPGAPGADGKDGAVGAPGADGAPGSDGRGIERIECEQVEGSYRWHVWYTDGTEDTDAGPCYSPPRGLVR